MILSTLTKMFRKIFLPSEVLSMAYKLESLKRLLNIHPADFCLALMPWAIGDDEKRSTATAPWGVLPTYRVHAPEESSFYTHFNSETLQILRLLFKKALEAATVERREVLDKILGKHD